MLLGNETFVNPVIECRVDTIQPKRSRSHNTQFLEHSRVRHSRCCLWADRAGVPPVVAFTPCVVGASAHSVHSAPGYPLRDASKHTQTHTRSHARCTSTRLKEHPVKLSRRTKVKKKINKSKGGCPWRGSTNVSSTSAIMFRKPHTVAEKFVKVLRGQRKVASEDHEEDAVPSSFDDANGIALSVLTEPDKCPGIFLGASNATRTTIVQ